MFRSFPALPFPPASLVALAPLDAIAARTAITGTSSYLDCLLLAPGLHTQQSAFRANDGELPATAALTTGYVFRVENQATVAFFQRVGVPGQLVNCAVASPGAGGAGVGTLAEVLWGSAICLTVAATVGLVALKDWYAVSCIGALVLARAVNVAVIRRQSRLGWKGAPEPGVHGDLLVLVSQDRWIRISGLVDDIKTVTSGQWMRNTTDVEGFAVSAATVLVYGTAAVMGVASATGSAVILGLLLAEAGLLGLSNAVAKRAVMFGRGISTIGSPKPYGRRTDLVKELVAETGREDWAIGLGMMVPSAGQAKEILL
ncbi:hypothetical protein BZA05DRAFT_379903 [Tricharina praecox]|uniref:uncharacterized protein n=1 Tax=Tricharina praecox TaxID=43433 RepID=UPI0022201650|nr:uncharacterized protein BZA05DRAFT_379903 [Tricharina praecox]KAI5842350.1 hypothetical protein BZA05DRAFT_379903 [Tricharina praecox]